mgnify:FL=1
MPTVYEIECDKCGGKVIDHVDPPKYEYLKIKASEYAMRQSQANITYDVYYYTHHKLICTECGHIEKYYV